MKDKGSCGIEPHGEPQPAGTQRRFGAIQSLLLADGTQGPVAVPRRCRPVGRLLWPSAGAGAAQCVRTLRTVWIGASMHARLPAVWLRPTLLHLRRSRTPPTHLADAPRARARRSWLDSRAPSGPQRSGGQPSRSSKHPKHPAAKLGAALAGGFWPSYKHPRAPYIAPGGASGCATG